MSEPTKITAGDTLQWTKTLGDYPASVWTLTYTLFNADAAYSFSATADGDNHNIDVPSATTATWAPGRYSWTAYVSDGTDQHAIADGSWVVAANPSVVTPHDGRTHARKMLDAIEAALEGNASTSELALISVTMGDRSISSKPELMLTLRDRYKAEVLAEERAAAVARGESRPNFIRVRQS